MHTLHTRRSKKQRVVLESRILTSHQSKECTKVNPNEKLFRLNRKRMKYYNNVRDAYALSQGMLKNCGIHRKVSQSLKVF